MRLLRPMPLVNLIVAFPTTFMNMPEREWHEKRINYWLQIYYNFDIFFYLNMSRTAVFSVYIRLPNKYFRLKNVSTTWPLSDWPLVITRWLLSNKISHFTLSVGIISIRLVRIYSFFFFSPIRCLCSNPDDDKLCNFSGEENFSELFIGFMWWNVYNF